MLFLNSHFYSENPNILIVNSAISTALIFRWERKEPCANQNELKERQWGIWARSWSAREKGVENANEKLAMVLKNMKQKLFVIKQLEVTNLEEKKNWVYYSTMALWWIRKSDQERRRCRNEILVY